MRIISLGYNCLVRTILTEWLLKPDRRSGEKGMVFDRAIHPTVMVADSMEKDFSDFFENWRFNPAPEFKCWFHLAPSALDLPLPIHNQDAKNRADNIVYLHDKDCGPNDLEKVQARTRRRLNIFIDTLEHPQKNDLYILHKRPGECPADVERFCRMIRKRRAGAPTYILVLVTTPEDPTEKIDGAITFRCLFPQKTGASGQTVKSKAYMFASMRMARICRKFIEETF